MVKSCTLQSAEAFTGPLESVFVCTGEARTCGGQGQCVAINATHNRLLGGLLILRKIAKCTTKTRILCHTGDPARTREC